MPNWLRHELLRSDIASSVEVDGLLLFADGVIAIAGDRAFQRLEPIDYDVAGCRLFRKAGSDVLRLTQSVNGIAKSTWFYYEHDIVSSICELIPDEPVPFDAMPLEPWKVPRIVVGFLRLLPH